MSVQPKTLIRPPVMTMATNMSHVVEFSDAFPIAAIVSTLSAKTSRHMVQLVLTLTQFVATLSRQLSWSYFVNRRQMYKDGITVAEYWTELPPKAELERHLHQALIEARERLARRGLLLEGGEDE